MNKIEEGRNMPSSSHANTADCLKQEALRIEDDSYSFIFDEIWRRETLGYETRELEEEEEEEELVEEDSEEE
jgi:hypothetical protein